MRRLTLIGIVPLVLATSVLTATTALLAACGDDSSPLRPAASPTALQQQSEREYDLDATGQAAAEQLGGHAAATYAILKAADNGYSPYQTAAAVDARLLSQSGVIEGVTPAGPAGGLLSDRPETTRPQVAGVTCSFASQDVVATASEPFAELGDFEQLFARLEAAGQSGPWLAWVLSATGAGYSVRQITEALSGEDANPHLTPPAWGVVAVLRDAGDNVVVPELGADWPYRGRNILNEVRKDPNLDFDDNLAVLVIGLVNAGYTAEQIEEALRWDKVALCSTTDGKAVTLGCTDEAGGLVPPAAAQPGSHPPGQIVIADISTLWPRQDATGQGTGGQGTSGEDAAARFQRGETVSLKLTPYFAKKDTGLKITQHDVIMTLVPSVTAGAADITCKWRIEMVQATADNRYSQGTTIVFEGEAYEEDGDSQLLRDFTHMKCDFTYSAFSPSGELDYTVTDSGGFGGHLSDYLEGDGFLGGGPTAVNWDTFPGVSEDSQ